MTVAVQKAALRRRMRQLRRDLGPEEVHRRSERVRVHVLSLPEVREATRILAYVAVRNEVETRALVQALIGMGKRVAVPEVQGANLVPRQLRRWADLAPGTFGVPTSSGPPLRRAPDVVLAPGLAFSPRGDRLGFGGGYYDRYLQAHPATWAAGLCYDEQIIPNLPVEPFDATLQAVVTPGGVLRCGRPAE